MAEESSGVGGGGNRSSAIGELASESHASFGTNINVQPQIPSERRNEFAVVTILLFQLGIRAFSVSAT